MGPIVAGVILVLVVVGVIGYIAVRATQGKPPPHANANAQPDAIHDTDGAVPRDPDGMPMAAPSDDPAGGVDDLHRRAQDPAERPDQV